MSKSSARIRAEAVRLAAQVLASRPEETPLPLAWSLAVFFEAYVTHGAAGTRKDFGPKKPVKLKVVRAPGTSN